MIYKSDRKALFGHPVSYAEQHKADGEKDHQCANSDALVVNGQTKDIQRYAIGKLADSGHQRSTHKGCALAANIHQTEVLAAALGRNDLAKIGAAQRLNTTLENMLLIPFYLSCL